MSMFHLVLALIVVAINVAHPTLASNGSLAEQYDSINDYLEKNVDSDDMLANLGAAKHWFELESSKPEEEQDSSLLDALGLFTSLNWILTNDSDWVGFKVLADNEEGLKNEARQSGGNYRLKRIDRVLEQFAIKQFELRGVTFFNEKFDLFYCLKRNMYKLINNFLVDNVMSDDIEANMAEAAELLNKTISVNGESALSDALQQFVSLKTVTTKNKCNEEGYLITLRNNLAIPHEKSRYSVRRIDKLINYYSIKNAEICQSEYPKIFSKLIRQLDMHTSRSLRVLLSESQLGHSNANETAQIQFRDSFTTPDLVCWYEKEAKDEDKTTIREIKNFNSITLFRILKSLVGKDLKRELVSSSKDEFGTLETEVDETKLDEFYENYLQKPCAQYYDTVGRLFLQLHNHWLIFSRIFVLFDYYDEMEKDLPKYVGLIAGRSAHTLCESISKHKLQYLDGLVKLLISDKRHETDY